MKIITLGQTRIEYKDAFRQTHQDYWTKKWDTPEHEKYSHSGFNDIIIRCDECNQESYKLIEFELEINNGKDNPVGSIRLCSNCLNKGLKLLNE